MAVNFNDRNNRLDIDRFKTVIMHEFGYLIDLPPICPDCIEAGCRFLDREIYNFMARRNRPYQHE